MSQYVVALKREFWDKGPALRDIFAQAHLPAPDSNIPAPRRALVELSDAQEQALHSFDKYVYIEKLVDHTP